MHLNAGSQNVVQQQQPFGHQRIDAGSLLEQSASSSMQTDLERGISNFDDCKQHSTLPDAHQQDHSGMSELHAHLPAAVSMTHDSTQ